MSGKYKIGDKVLCRVRPKKRIVYDEPYENGHLLESRAFELIGVNSNCYIVLVEDPTLASWPIDTQHIKENGILSSLKGKNAYGVLFEAIGGLAPQIALCTHCKEYDQNFKKRLDSDIPILLEASN